jgi:[CysO sulfur-carrier protein]-S-L-cysteine hydrolase
MQKLNINTDLIDAMSVDAIRCYPNEACGFLLGKLEDQREAVSFHACKNIQDELHAQDAERYPRTAATAYVMDPKDQKQVESLAKDKGLDIVAIVHSHPDHEAYFSAEDKGNAAPWGEPLFEGLSYVVVSVYDKKIKEIKDFFWSDESKDFVESVII